MTKEDLIEEILATTQVYFEAFDEPVRLAKLSRLYGIKAKALGTTVANLISDRRFADGINRDLCRLVFPAEMLIKKYPDALVRSGKFKDWKCQPVDIKETVISPDKDFNKAVLDTLSLDEPRSLIGITARLAEGGYKFTHDELKQAVRGLVAAGKAVNEGNDTVGAKIRLK